MRTKSTKSPNRREGPKAAVGTNRTRRVERVARSQHWTSRTNLQQRLPRQRTKMIVALDVQMRSKSRSTETFPALATRSPSGCTSPADSCTTSSTRRTAPSMASRPCRQPVAFGRASRVADNADSWILSLLLVREIRRIHGDDAIRRVSGVDGDADLVLTRCGRHRSAQTLRPSRRKSEWSKRNMNLLRHRRSPSSVRTYLSSSARGPRCPAQPSVTGPFPCGCR